MPVRVVHESGVADRISSGNGRLWLWLALLLFAVQVLPYPSRQWVTDESWYAAPAYSLVHSGGMKDPAIGPNDIENHFYVRPPGTSLEIAAFYKILGPGQVPARLGSMIGGALIVLLTYLLAGCLMDREGAIFAAFLVATDNFVVLTSRTARPDTLVALGVLASLFAMVRYRSGSIVYAAISGLLMACGAMFHATLAGFVISIAILAMIIDRSERRSILRGVAAYGSAFLTGLLPFAAWVMRTPLGREAFLGEYFHRVRRDSWLTKLLAERHRYSDFLGYNRLHRHGFELLPVRLPIPLLLLAATYVVWRYRRNWFYVELLLLVPTMLWYLNTPNKSSRYLATLSPVFALTVGAAIAISAVRPLLRRMLLVSASLAIVGQAAANFVVLRGARKADYTALAAKLDSVIPPGETVYGTMTFWLAVHDHPYISYERTDPWMAATEFHAHYFIGGDRMMANASLQSADSDFYRILNEHFREVTEGATVVGHFDDPYYGDLMVYKVNR